MRTRIFLLGSLLLSACATSVEHRPPETVFADSLFTNARPQIQAEALFQISAAMQAYLDDKVTAQARRKGVRLGLVETVRNELKLEYDTAVTRTAAETFDARAGNCLSLVIMTAAMAKQLGIPVHYQAVYGYDTWSRSQDIAFLSGHVNLRLGEPVRRSVLSSEQEPTLTVDFVPPQDLRNRLVLEIDEPTLTAMYFNNRAAETLAAGDVEGAYWWARAAIQAASTFASAYNTLGVIYRRHGNLAEAEQALNYALQREPENPQVLSNLKEVLSQQGRVEEAQAIQLRLTKIEPFPPFYFLDLGMAAMLTGDDRAAVENFNKELARIPYNHELHFALAIARLRLGDLRLARKHMALAMKNSVTRSSHDLYAAKLDRLDRLQVH